MSSEVSPAMEPVTNAPTVAAAAELLYAAASPPSQYVPFTDATVDSNNNVNPQMGQRLAIPASFGVNQIILPQHGTPATGDITIYNGTANAIPVTCNGLGVSVSSIQAGETLTFSLLDDTVWIRC